MKEAYRDLLYAKHHVSSRHPRMSRLGRASQFSAYKALDGHEAMINEEARLTGIQRELTDDEEKDLNCVIRYLIEHEYENIKVRLRYFKPDEKKDGGAYVGYVGEFRYYRADTRCLVWGNGLELPVESISEAEILQ